jgi:putative membrane protein
MGYDSQTLGLQSTGVANIVPAVTPISGQSIEVVIGLAKPKPASEDASATHIHQAAIPEERPCMILTEFLITWVVTAIGLWLVTLIVPGVRARSRRGLWVAALVLGTVNAFIRPALWWLTLPLTLLTFGAFALVVNALMIKLTAWLVADFEVKGFGTALLAALVMALLGMAGFVLFHWLLGDIHWTLMGPQPNGVAI